MRALGAITLLAMLAGCWADFPDDRIKHFDAKADHLRIDQAPGPDIRPIVDLLKCTPNAPIACTADRKSIIACGQLGYGTVEAPCGTYNCLDATHICDGCTPGAASCDGNNKVVCNAYGVPVRTACPNGCSNGACQ